ncbi:MAG: ABC transporter substrate-binding protein [Candidatus Methylomirabilia bacterium]
MSRRWSLLGLVVLVLALVTAACGGSKEKGPIVVGSKIDTEGALLSQMIILMLRDAGFAVEDRSEFGPTQVTRKALLSGELHIYPEYTGNGAFFYDEADSPVWKDAKRGYERVKQLSMERDRLVWLEPAPANNTWAIAIPRALSEREGITSLESFARYVNAGGTVKLAGSEEFVTSPAALPSFQEAYGFELRRDQLLTLSGGNTAQTESAAARGTDGVNATMAYGTDGSLSALDLVVLSDPKGAQPVYEPAPLARQEIIEKYPEIADRLNPVFRSLDLETLQALNAKIALEGQSAPAVAEEYLKANGFLD